MRLTSNELKQHLQTEFASGRYDSRLAKHYFIQLIKEKRLVIETTRGFYVYLPDENRYMFLHNSVKKLHIWLKERLVEISDEAEDLVSQPEIVKLFQEIRISPYLQGEESEFDSHPDLINTKAGVLKLNTNGTITLLAYDECDALFTVCVAAEYIPKEKRELTAFHKFADYSFSPEMREESILLLKQALGHMYSNKRNKKFLFYCVGSASCGKSLLQTLFQNSVGGEKAIEEGIITRQSLHQLNATAGTIKAVSQSSWLISGETSKAPLKNTDIIRSLTSHEGVQETIAGKSSSYISKAHFWIAGNWSSLEAFNNTDVDALKSRIVPLVFEKQTPEGVEHESLLQELSNEIDSIFSEAIDALVQLLQNSYQFSIPKLTEKKIKDGWLANNTFLWFLEVHCVKDENAYMLFDELYEAYQEHVLAFGKKLLDYKDCKKLFYNRTTQIRAKQPNGSRNRARKGYRLLTQLEQEMDYTSIEHLDSRIDTLREKNRRDNLTLQGKRLYPLVEYLLSDCSVETYKNL